MFLRGKYVFPNEMYRMRCPRKSRGQVLGLRPVHLSQQDRDYQLRNVQLFKKPIY